MSQLIEAGIRKGSVWPSLSCDRWLIGQTSEGGGGQSAQRRLRCKELVIRIANKPYIVLYSLHMFVLHCRSIHLCLRNARRTILYICWDYFEMCIRCSTESSRAFDILLYFNGSVKEGGGRGEAMADAQIVILNWQHRSADKWLQKQGWLFPDSHLVWIQTKQRNFIIRVAIWTNNR